MKLIKGAGTHRRPRNSVRRFCSRAPNPALQPKTQRHIEERFLELSVPIMDTRLYDREPFRAIFSFGGSVSSLADKGMSNLPAALSNARAFAAEVVERLRNGNKRLPK